MPLGYRVFGLFCGVESGGFRLAVSGPVLARFWPGFCPVLALELARFPWGLAPVLGWFWSPIGGAAVLSGGGMERSGRSRSGGVGEVRVLVPVLLGLGVFGGLGLAGVGLACLGNMVRNGLG